ncbi:MAG: hypothetical protein U5R30_16375 [Deltaproteobacteria bacterium]|nr:hypothetical protein [Deltaproteobacteria bacterium]
MVYDIDGFIPNFALMKISTFYWERGAIENILDYLKNVMLLDNNLLAAENATEILDWGQFLTWTERVVVESIEEYMKKTKTQKELKKRKLQKQMFNAKP